MTARTMPGKAMNENEQAEGYRGSLPASGLEIISTENWNLVVKSIFFNMDCCSQFFILIWFSDFDHIQNSIAF